MIPVVIDTDGGVDDAMALWWALLDPRVDVVGIFATWGNVPLDVAAGTCGSAAWGATIADRRPRPEDTGSGFHPCRVVLDVDADRFEAEAEKVLGG